MKQAKSLVDICHIDISILAFIILVAFGLLDL